ncbi:MAG TPA: potassium channel family protein [Acidimicrobiales bacterium]|nr:potassium channel family protein [Acidimicrobiales bacterium]
MRQRMRRGVLALASVLAIYYATPIGALPSTGGVVLSVFGLLAGLAAIVWLIVGQARRLAGADPEDASVRADGLTLLIFVVVPVFSLGFFAIEEADPSQFVGLDTKTDALYFTLSTLATVGFGDVHASGQLARALVAAQIAFNLVFLAAAVSVLTAFVRRRAGTISRPGLGPSVAQDVVEPEREAGEQG